MDRPRPVPWMASARTLLDRKNRRKTSWISLLGDPDAGVGHAQRAGVVAVHRDGGDDPAAVAGELDRVDSRLVSGTLEVGRLALDHDRPVGEVLVEPQVAAREEAGHRGVARLRRRSARQEVRAGWPAPRALVAREGQEVVGHRQEPLGVALDDVDHLLLGGSSSPAIPSSRSSMLPMMLVRGVRARGSRC